MNPRQRDALAEAWLDLIGERNAAERARVRVIHRANSDVRRMVQAELEAASKRAAHPVKLEAA